MNRTILLAVAASALPLTLLSAPAQAAPTDITRATTVFSTGDPGRDFSFAKNRGGVTYKTAAKADLRNFRTLYGLSGNADVLSFKFKVNAPTRAKSAQQVYTARVQVGTKTFAANYNHATNTRYLTRAAKRVACKAAASSVAGRVVTLNVPRACLGNPSAIKMRGETRVVRNGKTRVSDQTKWSPKKALNASAMTSWTLPEQYGDVTFVGNPADSNYVAESADLGASSYRADRHGVAFSVEVADPAHYAWEPNQRFHIDLISQGKVTGTLTIVPKRDESGTTSISGAGALATCTVATATIAKATGLLTARVPATCLNGQTAAFAVRSEVNSANGQVLYGTDTTPFGQPVLLG